MKELAEYWAPSVARSIPAGQTDTFEFIGFGGDLYAANRFGVAAADPAKLHKIKATAETDQGRETWFKDVQLLALQRLFSDRSFAGGIVIDTNRKLRIKVQNTDAAAQWVSINLNGYDKPEYLQKVEQYELADRPVPKPQFAYATETVQAGADQQRIVINLPAVDTHLARIAISSENDDDLIVSFNVDNEIIFPDRFVSAINDEFRNKSIIAPVLLEKHLRFEAFVTNLNGVNSREISIIAETYKV